MPIAEGAGHHERTGNLKATRRLLGGLATALTVAFLTAPTASATISPTLTLDQSGGTQAGASVPLGTDIQFAPDSDADSPKDLTLLFPPGLVSDASIDGGACLQIQPQANTEPDSACKVGTGTASAKVNGVLPTQQPLSLFLVAPPQPSDLAGIAVYMDNTHQQLGGTGDVLVRPSGDPAGVGLNVVFTNLPDTISFGGPSAPISLKELQTTLTAVRLPDSCPSTAVNYTITADSYNDSTLKTATAPLNVTGCSNLTLTPTFTVTASKDSSDSGTAVTTDLKQPASADEATSSQVVLTLPTNVLGPNVPAVLSGGILCQDPTFASCKTIGTASSTSPLYPKTLTGNVYLTGSLTAPAIALVFGPPFPITLSGSVDLSTGSTTFTGVPDLPLTDLQVALAGGPNAVFAASCKPSSGTGSTALTSQNGDKTVTVAAPFTVSGCPASTSTQTPQPTTPGTGNNPGSHGKAPKPGKPRLGSASLRRLSHHRFALKLKLLAGRNAPKLKSVTLTLPAALRLAVRRHHRLHLLVHVVAAGAHIARVRIVHGRLLVVFRRATSQATLTIRGPLNSTGKQHRQRKAKLIVAVTDVAGHHTRLPAKTLSLP